MEKKVETTMHIIIVLGISQPDNVIVCVSCSALFSI